MPEISVILPAYNAERFIGETIRSVLEQDMRDLELIIINDGSTDHTLGIARTFNDPRIIIIDQSNAGVSDARNVGIRRSKADFIAFLDADDILLPLSLRKRLEKITSAPDIVLVHSWVEVIDEKSHRTGELKKGKRGNVLEDLLLWNGDVIPGPSSALVRRSVLDQCGMFDPELSTAADQDFFFRIASCGTVEMTDEVLTLYRVHPGNMSSKIGLMERDHLLVYHKAKNRNAFRSSRFRRKCFSELYLILAGSWWVNGRNRWKGIKFIVRSIFIYPLNFFKVLRKLT